jgi:hypothetical protein
MLKHFSILAVRRPEKQRENSECFLTLTDKNIQSDNRYYVRLFRGNAEVDWQVGDSLLVDVCLCAYKTQGQWHMNKEQDSIELIESDKHSNNFKTVKK